MGAVDLCASGEEGAERAAVHRSRFFDVGVVEKRGGKIDERWRLGRGRAFRNDCGRR